MLKKLRILNIEDSEDDSVLVLHEFVKNKIDVFSKRVCTEETLYSVLHKNHWDIVLCDYVMPGFSGLVALDIVKKFNPNLPLIMVSGTIGEDVAVEAMRLGANDYLMKGNLKRLVPAVLRELRDSEDRIERKRVELALSESQKHIAIIANTIDDIIYSIDVQTEEFEYLSPVFERKLGYSLNDINQMGGRSSFLDRVIPDANFSKQNSLKNEVGKIEGKTIPIRENWWKCKDGSFLFIQDNSVPIYNGDILIKIHGVLHDVTEHKQSELMQSAVYQISQAINKAANLEEFYSLIHETISTVMPAENFYIALCNEENNYLNFPYFVDEVDTPPLPTKNRNGMSEYILSNGKPMLCYKDKILDLINNGSINPIGKPPEIWLGVPLTIEDKNIGVMAVQHYSDSNAYCLRDLQMLEYVSLQVAKAIELKQSQNIIVESEKRFKALAKLLPQTVFESNNNGVLTFANEAALNTFGYTQEDIDNGLNIIDVASEKDKSTFVENFKRVLQGLEPTKHEYELLNKDGIAFPVLTSTSAIIRDGKPIGIRGMVVDITERKQTENELIKLSEAVKQSPASIVITDLDGKIQYINNTFTKVTGYLYSEVIGKTPRILKSGHTSQEEYEELWAKIHSGSNWQGEFLNKKKNGELYWEEVIITPIKDKKGNIINFLAIKEDITKRKKIENELEMHRENLQELVNIKTEELNWTNDQLKEEIKKQKEAEEKIQLALVKEKELSDLKSQFISITSHEFRTPLTVIFSSVEIMERYGPQWDVEKFNQQIERIKKSVKFLTNLLEDVLIISREESGSDKFEPTKINLEDTCNNILEDIDLLKTPNHKINFEYKFKESKILLDEKLFKFIINNLLSNAVKYSPEGGEIVFRLWAEDKELLIEISDEGIGIPESDRLHLFEPFHRGSNVSDIRGTGLGMSIIKRSVDLHKGQIALANNSGKGTKFKIRLPFQKSE